jgi:germination protein M
MLLAVPLLAAGCGGGAHSLGPAPEQKAEAPIVQSSARPAKLLRLQVWLVHGQELISRPRSHRKTLRVATAAVKELLAGPTADERTGSGITTAIPSGTRLIGITIENGIATIDLTSQFQSGAGSHSMQLRLGQIVYTLTQFPTVSKVQFELDGTPVNVFSSEGIVLDHPVGRSDYKNLSGACAGILPSKQGFIVVSTPKPGDHVGDGFAVRGCSSSFEATLSWRLKTRDGKALASGIAQGGSYEPGPFSFTVDYRLPEDQPGVLEVYEPPASGEGGPTSRVTVPLVLAARP